MVRGKSISEKSFDIFNYIFLGLLAFIFIYPFIYCFIVAFNEGTDTMKGGLYFWPRAFTLDNFKRAFQNSGVSNAALISVGRTIIGTVLSVLLTSLAAFGLSYKDLPGRRPILFLTFFSSIFGGGLIPTYILFRSLNLLDSFWVFIIPSLYSFYNILLIRAYFQNSIPESLKESALIDGAGHFRVYAQIYLPLSMPIIATVSLFIAVGQWNDWFAGMYYIKNTKLIPLASILQKFVRELDFNTLNPEQMSVEQQSKVGQTITPESFKMAVLVITTVPIILVYPFLQKYFVKGAMIGSIKE